MSLAPEFAPDVVIPERARRTMPRPGRPRPDRAVRALRAVGRSTAPTGSAPRALVAPARPHRVAPPRRRPAAEPPRIESTEWSAMREVAVALPPREPVTLILRRRPAADPRARAAAPLRLTRRGAVVGAALVAAAALGLVLAAWLSAPPAGPAGADPMPAVVTVEPGDTLWSLATSLAPGSDPRAVVSDLRRLNGLESVTLQPGQLLRTR